MRSLLWFSKILLTKPELPSNDGGQFISAPESR
jgi:hypothetical protein